ncbi:MAG: transcriptional regulator [Alphaproteobacteria bacterium HGW-Alphaproteobacteria-12]|nr:MAG: transcriptional regulator [Alphaproteobacteria bacterium HGW-Alphaproteobacteria-12]
MAVSSEYKAFVIEQLERLGAVHTRNMFGGAGVYLDNLMFGLIAGETLYFKADERNRADYEDEGMGPFTVQLAHGGTGSFSYYEVPERLYDEPDELVDWARKALDATLAAKAARPARKKKTGKKKPPGKKSAPADV